MNPLAQLTPEQRRALSKMPENVALRLLEKMMPQGPATPATPAPSAGYGLGDRLDVHYDRAMPSPGRLPQGMNAGLDPYDPRFVPETQGFGGMGQPQPPRFPQGPATPATPAPSAGYGLGDRLDVHYDRAMPSPGRLPQGMNAGLDPYDPRFVPETQGFGGMGQPQPPRFPQVGQQPKGEEYDPDLMPGIGEDPRGMFWQEGRAPGDSFLPGAEYQTADMSGIDRNNLPYGDVKLTGEQSKDVGYFRRGLFANQTLSDPKMEKALLQVTDNFASNFGAAGRWFQDEDFQVADRAAREFLAVILRKDTGAAITNQEFELYGPMYLPQPNDKPGNLEAKRKARENALIGLEMGLGSAGALGAVVRRDVAPAKRRRFNPATGQFEEVE